MRFARRQHSRQRRDGQNRLGHGGRTPCGVAGFGDHGEHRLAQIAHRALGQDGFVVHDGAAVVRAWNVGCGHHPHHAGQGADFFDVDGGELTMRHRRQAQGHMQGARQFGQVVDISRFTGHVQMSRFVRAADANLRVGRVQDTGGQRCVHGCAASAPRAHVMSFQTLTSLADNGLLLRVSNQRRCNKFCATCMR